MSRPARLELAADLERVLRLAVAREPRRLGAVPVRAHDRARRSRCASSPACCAGRVRSRRGVAIARRLVHAGTTPLYARAPRGTVARVARAGLAHADPRFRRA